MSKIYLLTQGSYSDYHIVAAYSTKERADLGLAEHNRDVGGYDIAEIEEWDIDTYTPITEYYCVTMKKDGTIAGVSRSILYPGETLSEYHSVARANFWHDGVEFYFPFDEKERAVKVALEKWTEISAQNVWGNIEALNQIMGH